MCGAAASFQGVELGRNETLVLWSKSICTGITLKSRKHEDHPRSYERSGLHVVGKEILLAIFEFALDAVKTLSKEELMQLKILNNANFPGFGKLLGGGN